MKKHFHFALAGSVVGLLAMVTSLPANSRAAAGEIYVTNYISSTINIAVEGGDGGTPFAKGLSSPQGLAFDSSGNLYVANAGNNTIERFTPNGAHSIFAGAGAGLYDPFGLAFDSAGNLYVSNYNGAIVRFTPSGAHSIFSTASSPALGIAFDAQDNLFVANEGLQNILRITPDGVSTVFAATGAAGLDLPFDVAFSAAGDLYVVNNSSAGSNILRFNSAGVGKVFASKGLVDPQNLAFDAAGNLYVTDEQGFIERFNPEGGDSTLFYQTDFNYPVGLAIGPVPKPAAVSVRATNPMAIEAKKTGTFVLSRPAGNDSSALPVYFRLQGTAQDGVNYKEIRSPVIIPAGAQHAKIVITAIGNASEHGTRSVTLKLLARPAEYTLGSPSKATVSILGQ